MQGYTSNGWPGSSGEPEFRYRPTTGTRNKFPGACVGCGKSVSEGQGYLLKKEDGERWRVRCDACCHLYRFGAYQGPRFNPAPPPPPPVPACFLKLGIRPPVTTEDVKAAYRRLAMKTHPDRGGSAEAFRSIHGAYEAAMKLIGGAA